MKYYIDNNDVTWVYDDDVPQDVIDQQQVDYDVVFTSLTKEEYDNAVLPSLEDAVIMKIGEITEAFNLALTEPVRVLSKDWKGGYENAAKYKVAVDFAELAGQHDVGLKDIHDVKHTLSIEDAKQVLLAVGSDYITKDSTRDSLVAQAKAATSLADLDKIKIII